MNSDKVMMLLDGLLLLVFITLKLTHFIDWSWAWILSPVWIPIAFYFLLLAAVFILEIIKLLWRKRKNVK